MIDDDDLTISAAKCLHFLALQYIMVARRAGTNRNKEITLLSPDV